MNIILFDQLCRENFLPLSFTRPVSQIRLGIITITEKWERMLPGNYSFLTNEFLNVKYPLNTADDNYFIAGNVIPNPLLICEILNLNKGEALFINDDLIAFRGTLNDFEQRKITTSIRTVSKPARIQMLYDIFILNAKAIEADFRLLTENRESKPLNKSNQIIGNPLYPDGTPKIFIEEGAKLECTILNVSKGPVYIGKDAEIMEGSCIRGPFAACRQSVVNMGTKIYGATTIGPYCKVGGELNNVVMLGYSNKAHDGFLGNAVIGEWCNIGAGTNASNLKNDYSEIKLWNYPASRFLKTGLQFCGLMMGDHSKAGINCMFNTATILGVGVNVYGSGFPRNFVPSFSEGGTAGFTDVNLNKFFKTAAMMMERRGKSLTDADKAIFEYIYTQAEALK